MVLHGTMGKHHRLAYASSSMAYSRQSKGTKMMINFLPFVFLHEIMATWQVGLERLWLSLCQKPLWLQCMVISTHFDRDQNVIHIDLDWLEWDGFPLLYSPNRTPISRQKRRSMTNSYGNLDGETFTFNFCWWVAFQPIEGSAPPRGDDSTLSNFFIWGAFTNSRTPV